MHINSTVEGEQLLAQLMRAVPDRQWLFKYGRVPIQFSISSRMWEVSYLDLVADSFAYSFLASQRRSVHSGTLQGVCDRSSCR
jgi:hypothetical protein